MPAVLSLRDLACERDERSLFSGLSVEIVSGDLVQIVGPNGAGKTTLMKIITGLCEQFDGSVRWCGQSIRSYDFYAALLYLGHAPGIKASLTALENLRWYFGLNGKKQRGGLAQPSAAEFDAALAAVGLNGYQHVPAQQMSAGQQRRVALARLYLSKAPLWVLDEPFTAIDTHGVAALEQLLQQHTRDGGIVILTTHQAPKIAPLKIIDLGDYAGEAA